MSALVLLPDRNMHRHDWSGTFLPEANTLCGWLRPQVLSHTIRQLEPEVRRRDTFRLLDSRPYDVLYYLGHGVRYGLPSAGLRWPWHRRQFGRLIASAGCTKVVLYACSTGDGPGPGGDGGFADRLRDEAGVEVIAHTTAGPATTNPYARCFSQAPGTGGEWYFEPHEEGWLPWCRWLHLGLHRFQMSTMLLGQVRNAVWATVPQEAA